MKRLLRYAVPSLALLILGCAAPQGTSTKGTATNNSQYTYIGERTTSGTFANEHYQFSYSSPNSIYQSMPWKHFEGQKSKRATVFTIGMRGYDSYALNIEFKGSVDPKLTPVQAAGKEYTSLSFSPYEGNPACATTSTTRPIAISDRMIGHMAYCIDRAKKTLYEVSITWQSLTLAASSLDRVVQEDEACRNEKKKSPQAKCPDRISNLAASYNQFLSSFKFVAR